MANKIFLIGLMGSGKSFWAEKLANVLTIPFFDLDAEIERSEKRSITAIFQTDGQDEFRRKEAQALRAFSNYESFVLSTGGGTPCFNGNMQWMNEHGITIWIDESPDVTAERLKGQREHRPLVADLPEGGVREFLSDMLMNRRAYYEQAKLHLAGDQIKEENFLKIIRNE